MISYKRLQHSCNNVGNHEHVRVCVSPTVSRTFKIHKNQSKLILTDSLHLQNLQTAQYRKKKPKLNIEHYMTL